MRPRTACVPPTTSPSTSPRFGGTARNRLRNQRGGRVVELARAWRVHRLLEDARGPVAHAAELALLAGERVRETDAADVLLDLCGQFGDPLLPLLGGRPVAAPVTERDQEDERRRRKREQAELDVQREHHDRR